MSLDSPITINLDLTKPITTLVERTFDLVGVLHEPTRIKKRAEADAEAKLILAKADMKVGAVEQRAIQRMVREETRRQQTMESILDKSLPQLSETSTPESLSDEWILHFFEKCRNATTDEMQNLWSRILSGEANKPGSYSKKTVSLLAEIERTDAELFGRLVDFVWTIGDRSIPLITNAVDKIYTNHGVSFDDIKHLESLGLLSFDPLSGFALTLSGTKETTEVTIALVYASTVYTIEVPADKKLPVGKVMLTRPGYELLSICAPTPVGGIQKHVRDFYQSSGLKLQG